MESTGSTKIWSKTEDCFIEITESYITGLVRYQDSWNLAKVVYKTDNWTRQKLSSIIIQEILDLEVRDDKMIQKVRK